MRTPRCDRGSVTAEVVIALPVVLLSILACMQVCLLFFAQSVALAAAQHGVRAARAHDSDHNAGAGAARRYAEQTAGALLTSVSTTSTGDATTVRITVRGHSLSLVPFLPTIEVSEVAAGAIERFTTPRSAR
ncbi:TadE/TadG family type IV pilus assembly protein [Nonomuraea fuscirosea]|uniref:TadE/TadG family type IV pilus assembly protein n=1 Tax=Nonomuraea fuscirosea TaxID=1291556 RepID=UPI00342F981C